MTEDTIAAIATPPGKGGIGIVKISGSRSLKIVSKIFGTTRKGPEDCFQLESHRIVHGYIFDAEKHFVIDEVLLVPMLAPRSYTSEDVVEIQAHSGSIVMANILEGVIKAGARLAEPGEFTKRAFLNGRIDLTQAEAVADIINAKSITALKSAASQNLGDFKSSIEESRQKLINLLSLIEASIDFPGETGEFDELIPQSMGLDTIKDVLEKCRNAVKLYEDAHFLRDGINLVICGAPNVGKSSLMNRLVEKERSIVTSFPGTTRDLIEEPLNINGISFLISDTAGIHETEDPVEKIGIKKAEKKIEESDIILFMKEAGSEIDVKKVEAVIPDEKKLIFVINKIDLADADDDPAFTLPNKFNKTPVVKISALYNQGIDILKKTIMELAVKNFEITSSVVPNLRHKIALTHAVESLEAAKQGFLNRADEILISMDLKNSADYLGEITGNTVKIDILDNIFKNFCIGK